MFHCKALWSHEGFLRRNSLPGLKTPVFILRLRVDLESPVKVVHSEVVTQVREEQLSGPSGG
jgi:hypothetical protein